MLDTQLGLESGPSFLRCCVVTIPSPFFAFSSCARCSHQLGPCNLVEEFVDSIDVGGMFTDLIRDAQFTVGPIKSHRG